MSKLETAVQKAHPSGSWRAVRSLAVPAGVTSIHISERATTHQSAPGKIQEGKEESPLLGSRKSRGYFETANSSYSKS